jgi:predicted Zn-dependent protease
LQQLANRALDLSQTQGASNADTGAGRAQSQSIVIKNGIVEPIGGIRAAPLKLGRLGFTSATEF